MFDTIYFDKAYTCPVCQGEIHSVQVKAFENMLEDYHVKDCVGHAEEIKIVKEELFCDNCSKFTGKSVYIVAGRGILLGTAETLEEAKKLLNDLNQEKLVLWYHDLYQRYISERRDKESYEGFLEDLREWYGERVHERPETDTEIKRQRLQFIWNWRHLKGALNPVESVERFLTYNTVESKKQLETDGENEEELPEWEVVVEEPFSDEVVCKAIEKWLRDCCGC